jgi:hypothetical protein
LEFAHAERITIEEFVELQASTRRSAKVRKVDLLLARLAPGDTLLVSELSRLGRSVGEIITLIDTLVTRQIRVFALKEGLRLTGTQDLQTTVMVTLFGLFAEIERTLLSLRTKEALAVAKAAGKRLGPLFPPTFFSVRRCIMRPLITSLAVLALVATFALPANMGYAQATQNPCNSDAAEAANPCNPDAIEVVNPRNPNVAKKAANPRNPGAEKKK